MEVTTANFEDGLARLEALLPTCKFIAFDEEMTGIMLDRSTAPNVGDSPEVRYKKMKRVTEEFSLMQVGLCLFHEEESPVHTQEEVCIDGDAAENAASANTRLVATPFNFYTFPDAKAGGRIVMFASTVRAPPTKMHSLPPPAKLWNMQRTYRRHRLFPLRPADLQAAFHRENHMDFNKWINQGVPYLSRAQHDVAIDEAAAERDATADERPNVVLTREDDRKL